MGRPWKSNLIRFHDHGDTIAIQYGGSHLVNTMATYRKLNQWQSQSRDMVESFKRYYHNSFLDSQRQEAYNLFLGNYIWAQGQPMLWDLQTDYYLHHVDPRVWSDRIRRSYVHWYTPEFLVPRSLPHLEDTSIEHLRVEDVDDYWLEYYRPLAISSFLKIFSFRINTDTTGLPDKLMHDGRYDLSPFTPRKTHHESESPEKKLVRKGVTILDPSSENDRLAGGEPPIKSKQPSSDNSPMTQGILREAQAFDILLTNSSSWPTSITSFKPADKALMSQWTLNQFHLNSLNPSVTAAESEEYERYVGHPLNLPLVVSNEISDKFINRDFVEYVRKAQGDSYGDDEGILSRVGDEDIADYSEFVKVKDNPLTVNEEDGDKKRYKAYRQWLRGKSLFKQSKVDPEYRP